MENLQNLVERVYEAAMRLTCDETYSFAGPNRGVDDQACGRDGFRCGTCERVLCARHLKSHDCEAA